MIAQGIPHEWSFGEGSPWKTWYEVACYFAFVGCMVNLMLVLALKKKIPRTVIPWISKIFYLLVAIWVSGTVRWLLNAMVLHYPLYGVQTVAYLIDGYLVAALAGAGFWYLFRKEDNIFVRMARHKVNSERFKTMADTTRITGILEFDEQLVLWFCNPTGCRLFGLSVDQILGTYFCDYLLPSLDGLVRNDITEFVKNGQSELLKGEQPKEIVALRHIDATHVLHWPMEVTFSAYKLSESYRFVAIFRDISYRKELEQQLKLRDEDYVPRV
jgi:PAS domain S-box-containing protein